MPRRCIILFPLCKTLAALATTICKRNIPQNLRMQVDDVDMRLYGIGTANGYGRDGT